MREVVQRGLLLAAGLVFLLLAAIGLALPLVPTTPFLLLAAACFARSSERLHRWLLASPAFGPILRDWEQRGAVRLHVKVVATLLLAILVAVPVATQDFPDWMKAIAVTSSAGVLLFLWTRPS